MPVIGFLLALLVIGGVAAALLWQAGLLDRLFGRSGMREAEDFLEDLRRRAEDMKRRFRSG
ncbi:MAG TPA: hypothetical protein ENJ38_01655 [Rhodospirillales bacterium]|nr:hypothetical protein [Rhodospirillales bacterium]